MPAYPTLVQENDSDLKKVREVVSERASNGTFRARVLAETKAEFTVRHLLFGPERAVLDAFWAAHKDEPVDFIWQDGLVAYVVVMTQPPAYEPDGAITLATVLLSEV